MKMLMMILCLCALLCGCAAAPTFETLGDDIHNQSVTVKEAVAMIPAGAEAYVCENGTLWVCEDFDLQLQTLQAGDISETVQTLSGFLPEELTVMTGSFEDLDRYEWVWTAMSDEGELICRAVILDDGRYHYCLTAMGPAAIGSDLTDQWNPIFTSFSAS